MIGEERTSVRAPAKQGAEQGRRERATVWTRPLPLRLLVLVLVATTLIRSTAPLDARRSTLLGSTLYLPTYLVHGHDHDDHDDHDDGPGTLITLTAGPLAAVPNRQLPPTQPNARGHGSVLFPGFLFVLLPVLCRQPSPYGSAFCRPH